MSERIAYFDILRAIAIVGVVAHASGTGLSFDVASINFNFTVLWRNLLNFAVPLFLAISGFFESYAMIAIFNQPGEAVKAVKPSSFLYSFFLVIFLFKNQNWIRSTLLKKLSEMSFGIYFIHLFTLITCLLTGKQDCWGFDKVSSGLQ